MHIWLVVRCVLIAVSAVSTFFVALGPQAKPPIDWGSLLAIFAFFSVSIPILLGIQINSSRLTTLWLRPSWCLNPFNFRQPLQFFHLGAYVCLSQAFIVLVRLAVSEVSFYVEALVPLAMAAGVLLGLQLVMWVFGAKIERRA